VGTGKSQETYDHIKAPARMGHGIKDQNLTDLEIKENNN